VACSLRYDLLFFELLVYLTSGLVLRVCAFLRCSSLLICLWFSLVSLYSCLFLMGVVLLGWGGILWRIVFGCRVTVGEEDGGCFSGGWWRDLSVLLGSLGL